MTPPKLTAALRMAEKLTGIARVPLWRKALLRYGVAAGYEHMPMLKSVRPISTVVDIGANRGQFALAARYSCPKARIVSFEPQMEPAHQYRLMFATDPLAIVHCAAIGPSAGRAPIHISARDDSSSLLPITPQQNTLFPGTAEVGTATIEVGPLTSYLPPTLIQRPALLKLDVQGFELEALRGCEDVLDRFEHIYAECSFRCLYEGQALAHQVIRWLQERGFELRGVYNLSYDAKGQPIQGDFFFSRNESSNEE